MDRSIEGDLGTSPDSTGLPGQGQQALAGNTGGRSVTANPGYEPPGSSQHSDQYSSPAEESLPETQLQNRGREVVSPVTRLISVGELRSALSQTLCELRHDEILCRLNRISALSRLLEVLEVDGDKKKIAKTIVEQSANDDGLINTMKYDIGMDDSDIEAVVAFFRGKDEAITIFKNKHDKEIRARNEEQMRGQNASNQRKWQIQQSFEATKRAIQEELDSRDVAADGFESLAICASLLDADGQNFDKQRTVFVNNNDELGDLTDKSLSESMEILKAMKGGCNVFSFVYLFVYPEGILKIPELKVISGNIYSLLKPGGFVYIDRSRFALQNEDILSEVLIPAGFKREDVVYLRERTRCPYKCDKWKDIWIGMHGSEPVPGGIALLVRKEISGEHTK